jgi:hypothetical protein
LSVRSHLLRGAGIAAVLAPFAVSIAAHAVPDALAEAPVAARPALQFGEYLVHLGRLSDGQAAHGVFRFRNNGDAPLTVGDLAASCGCLQPILDRKTYQPGETGLFVVKADTAGEVAIDGDQVKQHFIDVPYTVGDDRAVARVHLKFVLPERHVVVEPRSLLVYQFGTEPTRREITITDHRVPPLSITRVECTSPLLEIEETISASIGDPLRATVAVTIPASLDRNIQTWVVVHTDDDAQPKIVVPINVETRPATPGLISQTPLHLLPNPADRR